MSICGMQIVPYHCLGWTGVLNLDSGLWTLDSGLWTLALALYPLGPERQGVAYLLLVLPYVHRE